MANISGSALHNFRERTTPNADPERTPNNETTGAQNTKEVLVKVKERLATVLTVRKNAVLAIEYFIGASPEFFKDGSIEQQKAYFDQAEKWLIKRHGQQNIVAITRQYDETSPHICAYVVPIDPKGKLNCSHFLDGRTKLSEMQTDFANICGRQFGLQRGIEGSNAKHITIKQYYAQIQTVTPEILTEIPPEPPPLTITQKLSAASGIETEYSRTHRQYLQAKLRRGAEEATQRKAQYSKAIQHDIERENKAAREVRLAELRATSTQVRNLPLDVVLERLGCIPEPKDKKNWRTPVGRITVDGMKFFAQDLGKGGGGAIDLVMMVEETDYTGALNRLTKDFGNEALIAQGASLFKASIEAAAKVPPKPYQAPEPKIENWPRVRKYLTETRCLSENLVDKLNELGKVYADKFSNVVFVLGEGLGVELRGTGDKPFHGVRGQKRPFMLSAKDENKIAFVESSIDAMSLYELGFKGHIASMSGNSSEVAKQLASHFRQKGMTVVAAFDNDRAGEQMAANLGQPTTRLCPKSKDWNDDLKTKRDGAKMVQTPAPTVIQQAHDDLKKDQQVKPQQRPRGFSR